MSYAIDLNSRQSARTLEQAIRQQAQAILEPRAWSSHQHLVCRLEPGGSPLDLDMVPLLGLSVLSRGEAGTWPVGVGDLPSEAVEVDDLRALVGTYLDGMILLGEQRYMFSSDVVRLLPSTAPGESNCIFLTRPAVLQVTQRRRFRRIVLSHSAQVELNWLRDGQERMGGVAWLCNVSGDGIACRTEERVAASIWIGDELDIEFTLAPGDTERFHLQGVLCNKTPTGTLGKCMLGIQFLTDESHSASADTARLLRQRLIERRHQLADMPKGVDF